MCNKRTHTLQSAINKKDTNYFQFTSFSMVGGMHSCVTFKIRTLQFINHNLSDSGALSTDTRSDMKGIWVSQTECVTAEMGA